MKNEKIEIKLKRIMASIILSIILSISTFIVPVNATTTEVKQVTVDYTGAVISVKSDKEIQKIVMYKKDSSGKFVKFFESDESGYTEKNFLVSRYRLSESDKTSIKVIITTDGEEAQNIEIDKVPKAPNPVPNPTPSQSTTPNPNPTTSTKPSNNPQPNDVTSISLNKSSITLNMPKTKTTTLKATIKPAKATSKITWETSNKNVATVDSKGKITAKSPGSCTITVKTENGKKATCKVKVQFKGKDVANGDRIYFLDTQNADSKSNDCILIESNGKYALIDTATPGKASRVKQYLTDLGIKELEWVLITHFDGDHYGGYKSISKKVKIKKVYMKKIPSASGYKTVKEAAESHGTKIAIVTDKANTSAKLGNIEFKFYNTGTTPSTINTKAGGTISSTGKNRQNIYSIVSVAKINGKKVVFTGDHEAQSKSYNQKDKILLQKICNQTAKQVGDIDVMKVIHHGYNGNTAAELKYYKPEYAIITHKDKLNNAAYQNIKKYTTNIKYTGTGTRILSINKDGKIHFTTLNNDD